MTSNLRISSAAVSDRGLSEKRPQNEDSYLEMGRSGIYAVADGVGGAQAGEVASQMAMEILGEAFTNLPDGADAESVMQTAIERANAAIFEMAHELPQLASMATTVVALHLAENIATIGHVGDSRLYRVDNEGTLYRETDDHSMVAEEVRAGRMTEEQAENHPSRNIISRALGAELTVDVDLKTIMIGPGTAFLICSDGITRHVADHEIKGVLTFGGDPPEICEYLKNLCYDRGAEDNLTAVVIKIAADAGQPIVPALEAPVDDDLDADEPTIATARSPFDSTIAVDPDDNEDDSLLELETRELRLPDVAELPTQDPGFADPSADQASQVPTPVAAQAEPAREFSMFGEQGLEADGEQKQSPFPRLLSAIGLILLGSIIGIAAYYFALRPSPVDTGGPQLSEMKSENIEFSSFEKNRRNVDADPAAYLKEVPPPEDAEDFYLIGRANMLMSEFPTARAAFIEAQKRIGDANMVNQKILRTDIAVALLITNDPTIQTRLKTEIQGPVKPQANANAESNR